MKRFTIITICALVGCAAPKRQVATPPIPTVSRQAAPVAGQAEGRAVIAPTARTVLWNHVQKEGDAYEVWHSTDCKQWARIAVVDFPVYQIASPLPAEFFKVRTTNHLSHLVSDWATTR
jgi:hypothetical protein